MHFRVNSIEELNLSRTKFHQLVNTKIYKRKQELFVVEKTESISQLKEQKVVQGLRFIVYALVTHPKLLTQTSLSPSRLRAHKS